MTVHSLSLCILFKRFNCVQQIFYGRFVSMATRTEESTVSIGELLKSRLWKPSTPYVKPLHYSFHRKIWHLALCSSRQQFCRHRSGKWSVLRSFIIVASCGMLWSFQCLQWPCRPLSSQVLGVRLDLSSQISSSHTNTHNSHSNKIMS